MKRRIRLLLLAAGICVGLVGVCCYGRGGTVCGIVRVDGEPCPDLEVWFLATVYPERIESELKSMPHGHASDPKPTFYRYTTRTGPDGSYCLRNLKPGLEYVFGAYGRKDIKSMSFRNRPFKVQRGAQTVDIDLYTQ